MARRRLAGRCVVSGLGGGVYRAPGWCVWQLGLEVGQRRQGCHLDKPLVQRRETKDEAIQHEFEPRMTRG